MIAIMIVGTAICQAPSNVPEAVQTEIEIAAEEDQWMHPSSVVQSG